MRVLIYVLLGVLVLGAIVRGIQLLWLKTRSDAAANDDENALLTTFDLWVGRILLYGLLLLFLMLALERGLTSYAPPPDLERPSMPPKSTSAPPPEPPATIPGRFY